MAHNTAPAIRCRYDGRFDGAETLQTIGSDTKFHRGLGYSGRKVLLMDLSDARSLEGCPRCGEDEMVVSVDVNPTDDDFADVYCTDVACPHFVGDEVEADMSRIRFTEPSMWDNTAECPDCGDRHTVQIERNSVLHDRLESTNWNHVQVPCDACEESQTASEQEGDA